MGDSYWKDELNKKSTKQSNKGSLSSYKLGKPCLRDIYYSQSTLSKHPFVFRTDRENIYKRTGLICTKSRRCMFQNHFTKAKSLSNSSHISYLLPSKKPLSNL